MEDKEIKEKKENAAEDIFPEDNNTGNEEMMLDDIGIEIIEVDENEYNIGKKRKNIFSRVRKKIKKWKKNKIVAILWQLVSSIFLLALAGGIGIFVAVGQMRGGPKVFAEEYFGYYMNNNWYNLYQKTEIDESRFINLSTFSQMMSQNAIDGNVTDYEVIVDSRSGEFASVRVKYNVDKEVNEPQETVEPAEEENTENAEPVTENTEGVYSMTLKRQPENILLVFSTWKGWADNYIIKDCTIEVPSYAKVTFDGMDISDCLTGTNEETGNAIYTLDRIFMGNHTLKIEGESIDTITQNVLWEKNYEKYELLPDSISIRAEHKDNIQKKAVEILQAYYASGLSDGSADEIKPLLLENEEGYAHVDEQIEALYNEINRADGRTLISMEITSLKYELTDFVYNNSVTVKMIYDVSYTAKGERTAISGYRKNYTGKNTATSAVYFKYTDGEWHAVDTAVTCVDYTVEGEDEQ